MAGNCLRKVEPAGTTATYDAAKQFLTLNGLPIQYDPNGNLLSDGTATSTYDALSRVLTVGAGNEQRSYTYNDDDVLVAQGANGVQTSFPQGSRAPLSDVVARAGDLGLV